MTVSSNLTLKSYFQTGDRPTQAQFSELIDRVSYGNYVNVVDYGVSAANPDNAAAILAAVSGAPGRTLYFPGSGGSGKTYLTSQVTLTGQAPFSLTGDGIDKTIIKLKSSADSDIFYGVSADNLSFTSLTLDGNKSVNKTVGGHGNAFQFINSKYHVYENLKLNNFADIGTHFTGCSHIKVYNGTVKNSIGGWYFAANLSAGSDPISSEDVHLLACNVSGSTGGDTFSFDNVNRNCSWTDCVSTNSFADGFIVFSNIGSAGSEISINNCRVYNAGNNGMSIASTRSVVITNPIIDTTGLSSSSSAAAVGWGNGIQISNQEASQSKVSRINIIGGVLRNIQKHGVRILDTQTTTVSAVSITGIDIEGVGSVTANTFDCININNCNGVNITGGRLAPGGAGRNAINIGASANGTRIIGPTLVSSGAAPVVINAGTNTVMFAPGDPEPGYTNTGSLTLPASAAIRAHNTAKMLAHVFNNSGTPVSGGTCFNVNSFTDNGVGDWTITCGTSIATLANDTYWTANAMSGSGAKLFSTITAFTTNSVRVVTYSDTGVATDPTRLFVYGFGL